MSSSLAAVRWTFPDLPAEFGFLEEIDRTLCAAELVEVTRRIHASRAWRDHVVVSPTLRDFRLIYENAFTDVWALSWLPGQTTGFHDHDLSEVGVTVAHEDGAPAVPLHAYAPPLAWVGQYRERAGRLLRLREPGRTRLAP